MNNTMSAEGPSPDGSELNNKTRMKSPQFFPFIKHAIDSLHRSSAFYQESRAERVIALRKEKLVQLPTESTGIIPIKVLEAIDDRPHFIPFHNGIEWQEIWISKPDPEQDIWVTYSHEAESNTATICTVAMLSGERLMQADGSDPAINKPVTVAFTGKKTTVTSDFDSGDQEIPSPTVISSDNLITYQMLLKDQI